MIMKQKTLTFARSAILLSMVAAGCNRQDNTLTPSEIVRVPRVRIPRMDSPEYQEGEAKQRKNNPFYDAGKIWKGVRVTSNNIDPVIDRGIFWSKQKMTKPEIESRIGRDRLYISEYAEKVRVGVRKLPAFSHHLPVAKQKALLTRVMVVERIVQKLKKFSQTDNWKETQSMQAKLKKALDTIEVLYPSAEFVYYDSFYKGGMLPEPSPKP